MSEKILIWFSIGVAEFSLSAPRWGCFVSTGLSDGSFRLPIIILGLLSWNFVEVVVSRGSNYEKLVVSPLVGFDISNPTLADAGKCAKFDGATELTADGSFVTTKS
jgi:hypothetical protein